MHFFSIKKRCFVFFTLIILTCTSVFSQPLIEDKPQVAQYLRIVSLAPNVTETVFALGCGDLLVGRTDYCNYPLEAENLPSIGTLYNPSLEKILSLEPDLVISSTFINDQLRASLIKAGIEVLFIDIQENFLGTYAFIREIAQRIDRIEKGELIILEMQNEVRRITEQARLLQKISVYLMIDFGSFDGTATGDTYLGQMLELVGADNIAKEATLWTYSKELLIKNDPDLIIISPRWGETPEETIALFSSTKPYSDLRATKEGNLVTIDADMISRQGPRSAQALKLLAQAVHGKAWL